MMKSHHATCYVMREPPYGYLPEGEAPKAVSCTRRDCLRLTWGRPPRPHVPHRNAVAPQSLFLIRRGIEEAGSGLVFN